MPKMYHDHWWTCFPAIPKDKADPSYARIMRVCADHTLNNPTGTANRSVYKHGGEDHLVLAFFENFAVDTRGQWVTWLADHLAMRSGNIAAFNWSYFYEERVCGESRPRIADVVVCWKDDRDVAAIVIEAKRKGGVPKDGINAKDDPRQGYYLNYSPMRGISRKQQMLLIDEADTRFVDPELQADARLITWQKLVALQRDIFVQSCPERLRPVIERRLNAQYAELGLHTRTDGDVEPLDTSLLREDVHSALASWLCASNAYFAARRGDHNPPAPFAWLMNEPTREALLGARKQLTKDREKPIWQIPP